MILLFKSLGMLLFLGGMVLVWIALAGRDDTVYTLLGKLDEHTVESRVSVQARGCVGFAGTVIGLAGFGMIYLAWVLE